MGGFLRLTWSPLAAMQAAGVAALALAATAAVLVLLAHPFDSSAGRPPAGLHRLGGFYISLPLYSIAPWDPSRIGSFSFELQPVTPRTFVRAGVVPKKLADSCKVGTIARDTATVTCSYDPASAPTLRAASALQVVASG